MLYILYDNDYSEQPVCGVYSTLEKAQAAKQIYVDAEVDRILKDESQDHGLDPNNSQDVEWLREDTANLYRIQKLEKNIDF